ncbi:hypothetical protein [Microterricola viridarii]|nr:hypothetical protein [Microterricola viridarii]
MPLRHTLGFVATRAADVTLVDGLGQFATVATYDSMTGFVS